MPVDFFIARDFAMLIDAQASSRIEYAIYSATAYATAAELCQCVEPLAAAVDIDGAAGIRSILIGRKGTADDVADIAKVRLVVPPADSIPGWLAPLSLLGKEGLSLKGDEPYVTRAGSAVEAEAIFAKGEAGALLGWERVSPTGDALPQGGTMDRLRRAGVDVDGLELIWSSPVIPYGPHAVLKSINGEARQLLTEYLISLHGSDPQAYDLVSGGHGGGFVAIADDAYAAAREIVRSTAQRAFP